MQEREQLAREHVGAGERQLGRALEEVEREDGGDGDADADGRGDERLGDARHDGLGRSLRGGGCGGAGGRGRGLRRLAELVERLDDADDGAEEADERRVGAERPEERQPALQDAALHGGLRGHGLVRLLGRRLVDLAAHATEGDGGGGVTGLAHRRPRLLEAAGAQRLGQRLAERVDVVTPHPEHVRALQDDGDREDAETDQEPQHPGSPGADHDVLCVLDEVHSISCSWVASGAPSTGGLRCPEPSAEGAAVPREASRIEHAASITEVA